MAASKRPPGGGTNRSRPTTGGASSNRAPKNAATLGRAAQRSRAQGRGGPDSPTAQRIYNQMTGPQKGRPRNR